MSTLGEDLDKVAKLALEIKAQRDELLEACRLFHDCAFLDSRCTEEQWITATNAVEAAIAKAEGRA